MKFNAKQAPLIFAHIGDLHITDAKQQNYQDFLSIVAQLAAEAGEQLDFVLLPGDNADNGLAVQYRLIKPVLRMLTVPTYALSGDHDMEQGSLNNFYHELQDRKLPFRETVKGVNCVFLDICGPGTGGPDFRLGTKQLDGLRDILQDCTTTGQPNVVFMHAYPNDLKSEAERKQILKLFKECNTLLVDMGHTHYNELANNGKTIYSAVRSTGQIEEGPVGYALISIDSGAVSWRFKALDDPFPLVMITYPADYRLCRPEDRPAGTGTMIRATVIGSVPIRQVTCKLGDENPVPMNYDPNRKDWFVNMQLPATPLAKLAVEAITVEGRPGRHQLEISTSAYQPVSKAGKDGSDQLGIGAWPENGVLGTQLGPNRNAKPHPKS